MPPFLEVLKNRNFRSLWLGQIFSQISVNMLMFVLVLRVYETTGSNTAVSLVILCMGVPAIIFGVLAGTLVDQWEKRNVLVVTNLIRMVLILGFFISSETAIWIYFLVIAVSISTQFFVPSEAPTIPRIVEEKWLLTANSLFTLSFYATVVLGFILAGPALRFFGPRNVFLFLSWLLALAAFFVFQIDPETKTCLPAGRKERRKIATGELFSVWHDFWQGARLVIREKELSEPILLLTGSQALIASLASLAPGFSHQILQIEVKDASLVMMGPGAMGMILGALLIGNFGKNFPKERIVNLGIILTGVFLISLAVLARYTHLWLAVVSLLFLGAANSLVNVPANTNLQEKTPAELRGRVYGILTSLMGGAAILPVALVGLLADLFGVGKVIFSMAIIILGYGVYRMIKKKI